MTSSVYVTVSSLHIYPVKSCRGISLPITELTPRGLARDREWMVVDAAGRFLTQRELPRMALVKTEFAADHLRLSAPGQSEFLELPLAERTLPHRPVRVWDDDCEALDEGEEAAEWFGRFLGKSARLVRFDPAHRRLSSHEWTRSVDAENRFSDAFPVLIISEESLDELNRRLTSPLPMNRFRPNIVVRGSGAHGEDHIDALDGDGFEIRLVKPCVRCRITATDQATAEVGKEPLQTLATYRRDAVLEGVTFGMNGIVAARPGARLAVGMRLTAGS